MTNEEKIQFLAQVFQKREIDEQLSTDEQVTLRAIAGNII